MAVISRIYLSLKQIFFLAGKHRQKVALGAICILLADLSTLVFLPLLAQVGAISATGQLLNSHVQGIIIPSALAIILLRYTLLAVGNVASHQAAFDTMYDLRIKLAQKIGTLPLGDVSERGSTILKKIVLQDTEALHTVLGHYINDFIAGIIVPAATLTFLFLINWQLALATAALLPFLILTFQATYKDHADLSDAYFKATDEMQETVVEYVNGISVVKTFNRDMSKKLASAVEDQIVRRSKWARMTNTPWALFCILSECSLLFVAPLGLWMTMTGQIQTQTFLLVLLLTLGYTQPLLRLAVQLGFMSEARKSLARVQSLLEQPALSTIENPQTPRGNDISFTNVSFSYQDKPALRNINIDIKEGTFCALVGPSGAGKTTLAKLIGRFWDVNDGAISIGGVDLRHMSEAELYRRVSFVFQDVFLFRGTIADNLKMADQNATHEELVAAAKNARAHEFIMSLPHGYDTMVGEKGALLSGGQKQRLSIARALLRDTPILIMDEATAHADPINEVEIHKALTTLMKGRTVILIVHRLSKISDADQIIVLENGNVTGNGKHKDLMQTSKTYEKLWIDQNNATDRLGKAA